MIFYFSGQFPKSRKDYPKDSELKFFTQNGMEYNHLISLMYGKDADQILKNTKLMEEANGKGKQNGTGETAKPSRRRSRKS